MTPAGPAAYGLRVAGIEDDQALAVRAGEDWPLIEVRTAIGPRPDEREQFIDERAASVLTPAAHLLVDRASRRLLVTSAVPLPASDLVHPCLWPAAAVVARWQGAETVHAGAFLDDTGAAWALLGDRGAGKSSLLAALALGGHQILVDDLLVISGRECFAGPRCLDLRPEAVEQLGVRGRTVPVRSTARHRLALGPSEGAFVLRGFVHLEWGERLSVEPMAPAEHFGGLTRQRRIVHLGADPAQLLELAGLPALRLVREPDWAQLEEACAALLAACARPPAWQPA